jgi:heme b synthase
MRDHTQTSGPVPRIIAWESTRACNLACIHCRAAAQFEPAPDELTTDEVLALIDDIAAFARPVFVISGGEPLMRADIFDIAAYANERGLRVAMSPNGTLITPESVERMKAAGVKRISVSIDGSTAERHDAIRGVSGAFEGAVRGLEACRAGGLGFQLNTTVIRHNIDDLAAVHRRAIALGAEAWHVFMLVPTGRGQIDDEISPLQYEDTLNWIYETALASPIPIRVTCGPHFMRIVAQRQHEGSPPNLVRSGHGRGLDAMSKGCLAGNGFCFVSHRGEVYPCGYFPVLAGNVREQSFREIYQQSPLFCELRDPNLLKGKCGVCPFRRLCGGCRARAYSLTGDYLAAEPYCVYEPKGGEQER